MPPFPALHRAVGAGLGLALAIAVLSAAPRVAAAEPVPHASASADQSAFRYVPGANALEGRIRAPCCWTQTLDIHGSEVSNELRREIRRRLEAGEAAEAIEADFVLRYGERIRAVPPGNPLKQMAIVLALAFAAAGVTAGWLLVRWRRRSQAVAAKEAEQAKRRRAKKPERDRYDDLIDAELDEL